MTFVDSVITKEQRIFLMKSGWFIIVSVHILWVCGWLGFMGVSAPFAMANELREAVQGLKEDRIERLDQQILTIRIAQCRSQPDTPAREMYTERLNELYRKYKELKQEEPRIPRCDEI